MAFGEATKAVNSWRTPTVWYLKQATYNLFFFPFLPDFAWCLRYATSAPPQSQASPLIFTLALSIGSVLRLTRPPQRRRSNEPPDQQL